ncbi:23703_t:CDS:2 [Entrophospora sp. SA101]|nr:12557_t:CDS:2 [Entrophospora sp. SA101]CAJ0759826.1 23703_t:CDS:2 [Entrophospora sp. SA101]CAJ0827303.1 5480_t:CDS:2 [Entrophospora sp. SA101]CAJ0840626.1 890_t:CDS:2 [Entrophospora sp. SA101]CAJ0913250.1 436_t:CDS:2 [Entrophospora sp. SA101]
MAFTLAAWEILLNPKHPKISVSDNALQSRYEKYWGYVTDPDDNESEFEHGIESS